MDRGDLEGLISVYEGGYEEIQGILEDNELSTLEKVDAISDVVYGDEDADTDDKESD